MDDDRTRQELIQRINELEDLINQHRRFRTNNNDFNFADQILWDTLRKQKNDDSDDRRHM